MNKILLMAIVLLGSLNLFAESLCLDLFKLNPLETPIQQMQNFEHADPYFVKQIAMVKRLMLEKNRSQSALNWTADQTRDVKFLFPEKPALAKSVYRSIVDLLIEYESVDVIYMIDEFLNKEFRTAIQNQSSFQLLGPAPVSNFRWRLLLYAVLLVHGDLNLSLRQYGLLAQLNQIIQSGHPTVSNIELSIQILPLLKMAFPGSIIATDKGALQMLAYTETGKSCCGHGCSGCFKYVVTSGLRKLGELNNSTLPLVQIIKDRNKEP